MACVPKGGKGEGGMFRGRELEGRKEGRKEGLGSISIILSIFLNISLSPSLSRNKIRPVST